MSEWLPILPLIIVTVAGLLLMLLEVSMKQEVPAVFAGVSLVALAFAAAAPVIDWTMHKGAAVKYVLFEGALTVDSYSYFFTVLLIACAAITIVAAWNYLPREHMGHGEVYSVLMFSLAGMLTLASGTSLIALFIGVEVMSIAVYVLVGARRNVLKGNESALKYYLLGAFASGILLYGIALIYGATGSVQLDAIRTFLANPGEGKLPLLVVGLGLLIVGMGFKVAAAPFHAWTPDVYEGAPAPITGYMATAVKVASFAFFVRVLATGFLPIKPYWVDVIAALAVITMFTGNLSAFVQTNVKRMLAYSSIAHTGYLLMGLVALTGSPDGTSAAAILYYLVAYSVTNLGAFACIAFLSKQGETLVEFEDYAGVAKKFPLIALILAICMASLIGIPPTAGFFGKYFLFSSVIQQGYTWLAVVGIINSILSVYYYLRLVVVMYMKEPKADWTGVGGLQPARIAGIICAIVVIWAGMGATNLLSLVPGAAPLLAWAKTSVTTLF
ncbi:MAG TPA: NADH-quinone oxidoreductase subunit N [Stenomitos sp.]